MNYIKIEDDKIKYIDLPNSYNGVEKVDEGYKNRTDLHAKDGFLKEVFPELKENERHLPLTIDDCDLEAGTATHRVGQIPQPTDEELKELALQEIKQRYENHKQNGWEAYQTFRAKIVQAIANEELTEENAFNIEQFLSVAYDKIAQSGDWKTAHFKLSKVVIPEQYSFAQSYLDTALINLQTYIAENYE